MKSYNLSSLLCPSPCHPLRSLVHPASLLADSVKGLISTSYCSLGWSLYSSAHDDCLCSSRLPRALKLQWIADVYCTWMLNIPFHHPFLRCSPSTFCCLCSLQPTLPANLLCHYTVNERIWHGPWFATRVPPPTHTLASAFWHVKTCFTQTLSCEPVVISDALSFWLPTEITAPCLIQLPVGVQLSHRKFFCCYI